MAVQVEDLKQQGASSKRDYEADKAALRNDLEALRMTSADLQQKVEVQRQRNDQLDRQCERYEQQVQSLNLALEKARGDSNLQKVRHGSGMGQAWAQQAHAASISAP